MCNDVQWFLLLYQGTHPKVIVSKFKYNGSVQRSVPRYGDCSELVVLVLECCSDHGSSDVERSQAFTVL